jgi:2-amino-4-hydroxy-6-hydroxymethyldihydropteridine diphosphokinase
MKLIYLSLGSNLGHREQHLERALTLIQSRIGPLEKVSSIYESEPWGYSGSQHFYNCCAILKTSLDPIELMELLLKIEQDMGRHREGHGYSDRIIDIDLLLYGDSLVNQPSLKVPHPSMADRKFVLVPLAEIAANQIHPATGKSIQKMLEECTDPSEPKPIPYRFFSRSSSQNI